MEEWMFSSTIRDLGSRWRSGEVSFTLLLLHSQGTSPRSAGWVPEKRKVLSLPGIKPGLVACTCHYTDSYHNFSYLHSSNTDLSTKQTGHVSLAVMSECVRNCPQFLDMNASMKSEIYQYQFHFQFFVTWIALLSFDLIWCWITFVVNIVLSNKSVSFCDNPYLRSDWD
jgi:hypothetical protein